MCDGIKTESLDFLSEEKTATWLGIHLNLTNDLIHPIQIVDTLRERSLYQMPLDYAMQHIRLLLLLCTDDDAAAADTVALFSSIQFRLVAVGVIV